MIRHEGFHNRVLHQREGEREREGESEGGLERERRGRAREGGRGRESGRERGREGGRAGARGREGGRPGEGEERERCYYVYWRQRPRRRDLPRLVINPLTAEALKTITLKLLPVAGFISIDCGLNSANPYNDTEKGLTFSPDAPYTSA